MTNSEFFEYLSVLGKLPDLSGVQEWYRLLVENDVNIQKYYTVYSKIRINMNYTDGFYKFMQSGIRLIKTSKNQKEFDALVNGLDNIVNNIIKYSKHNKFLISLENNYLNIIDDIITNLDNIEDKIKAFKIIVNPEYVYLNNNIYLCDCEDGDPISHFNLMRNSDIKENISMIIYHRGYNEVYEIKNAGEYKRNIRMLQKRLNNNTLDFVVCANRDEYRTKYLFDVLLGK